jgi:putative tryptophan/tyrosine transport system substrate-binding protein
VRRRDLIAVIAGAATLRPLALRAQQKAIPVIGYLGVAAPSPYDPRVAAFRQGLSETGFVEPQNVTIEYRWAEGHYDRLPAFAAELVDRKVDVIVASGGPAPARAAKNATSTIPIVFATGGDPVDFGLVTSLARPGGNLTGVSVLANELMPKRIELLTELVPQAKLIGILVNPMPSNTDNLQGAARAKGLQLQILNARNEDEIEIWGGHKGASWFGFSGHARIGRAPGLKNRRETAGVIRDQRRKLLVLISSHPDKRILLALGEEATHG